MGWRMATVTALPSPRAFEATTARLRALLPSASVEGEATPEGFRWTLRVPNPVAADLIAPPRGGQPSLRLEMALLAREPGVELRRYSIRSARYVFLWLTLHLGAVGPIAFFFWDPLGLRKDGPLPNLLLFLPLAGLIAAMLSLLLAILKPRWTNLGAILTPRGTATGNAWIARGLVAPLHQALGDPTTRGIIETRGVQRIAIAGSTLAIEAQGPVDALQVPRAEAILLEKGYGQEVQRAVDARFAAALAGQIVDLLSVARALGARREAPATADRRGIPGWTP